MAEINEFKGSKNTHVTPRVDLTPMVDLGFLLITFFIFTTSLSEARTMEVNMPYRDANAHPSEVPEEATITIIPVDSHQVAYYNGSLEEQESYFTTPLNNDNGLRSLLTQKQKELSGLPSTYSSQAHHLHVIIKPHESSSYKDLVDVLDEMSILNVRYYAIDELNDAERRWLKESATE